MAAIDERLLKEGIGQGLDLRARRWGLLVKRALDVVGAIIGLLLCWPLLLVLAILIRRDSPGPVIFKQRRIGRGGRMFDLYKLRTMVVGAENIGPGLAIEPNDARITPIGRWLRSTSLDELPQLWNILRGDMSFVGPRPLPAPYFERWTDRQKMRLLMPQGLTGWAQIQGRNDITWEERFEMDVWYVENWSLWLDVKIFVLTVGAVLSRRGIAGKDGRVTEFGKRPKENS